MKDRKGIIHGIDLIGDAIAKAEQNNTTEAVKVQTPEQTTSTPSTKVPEQTTPATIEAQPTPTAQTAPANPSVTEATKTQEPEQSAPNIQPPVPGNGADVVLRAYLANGYYKGEGTSRYIDPELVDGSAKQLAKELAAGGLKQSAMNPILRELKRANKKTLPMEAKRGALAGAIPQAKQLVQRKRAPGLLVEVLEYNRSAIHESADYIAAVKHLTAVCVFLADYQS